VERSPRGSAWRAQAIEAVYRRMNRLIVPLLRAPILFYRWVVSPWIPSSCRFVPTCSGYALEALDRLGPIVGGSLALRRLCRCHPWGGMGYDPVPNARNDDTQLPTRLSFSDTPRF
jgi:putative membrane protein insertion efficiency factor